MFKRTFTVSQVAVHKLPCSSTAFFPPRVWRLGWTIPAHYSPECNSRGGAPCNASYQIRRGCTALNVFALLRETSLEIPIWGHELKVEGAILDYAHHVIAWDKVSRVLSIEVTRVLCSDELPLCDPAMNLFVHDHVDFCAAIAMAKSFTILINLLIHYCCSYLFVRVVLLTLHTTDW